MLEIHKKIPLFRLLTLIFSFIFFFSFTQPSCASANEDKTKLCLTMIVKNESQIIERCLNNVKDIIDCVCICDTGSTDNTVEIIEQFLQTHHIPGKVHRHSWENFGHNRTLSALSAQQTLKDLGFPLRHTYLLLLDADMILKIPPEFNKKQLTKDSYTIVQKSQWMSYYNIRLIRASLPWKCVGVTHEAWMCTKKASTDRLDTLWIDDLEDGGCKSDKFERDLRLLKKGLEDEPDNTRYMFYLAQTHKCLKQYDEAIHWYNKRIAKGGWKEEVWYAKLMLGDIYNAQEDWNRALIAYLEAFQYNPDRAEPLEKIALHYRLNEQYDLAYLFASQGAKIPYPSNEILFIADPVYNYRFDEELSIAAYYTPYREEGLLAEERLLRNKKVPGFIKWQTEKNLRFYVKPLEEATFQPILFDVPFVREDLNLRRNPMNPSILKVDDGYLVICRCVDYTQKGAQYFKMIDPAFGDELWIQARNFLLKYDKDFHLVWQKEMIDEISSSLQFSSNSMVKGVEDSRIFQHNNGLWATCTVYDMSPNHMPQIGLFELEDLAADAPTARLKSLVPLKGPDPERCEKNWLSFTKENNIYAIYSYDPLVVYQIDPATGECTEAFHHVSNDDYSYFRGSAGPIPFDDGYLIVVHQVAFDGERFYFHRFVQLDQNYQITHVSKPFIYTHLGIEYCCGMTVDHSGEKLVMTIGIEDREALLAFINLNRVRSLLEKIQ